MNGKVAQFQAPAGTPLVGQPFTIQAIKIPFDMTMTCNCLIGGTVLEVVNGDPVECPGCHKTYTPVLAVNMQMQISSPTSEVVA